VTRIIPIGYLTIRQAADVVAASLFSGIEERALVAKLRQAGKDVADGAAITDAIAEIWKAADVGTLRVVAIGGKPRKILKVDPEDLKEIPFLRSRGGGDLNLLRPRHRLYKQVTAWFGLELQDITIAFREKEVTELARSVFRSRRKALKSDGIKKGVGRPGRQAEVREVIRNVIASGKWEPTQSIKALTRLVNRHGKWAAPASSDTVGRALDGLYEATADRSFQRPKKRQQAIRHRDT